MYLTCIAIEPLLIGLGTKSKEGKEVYLAIMSFLSPKARRIIITGAVTMATVSGSLYGAGLKMNQDAKQVILLIVSSCLRHQF